MFDGNDANPSGERAGGGVVRGTPSRRRRVAFAQSSCMKRVVRLFSEKEDGRGIESGILQLGFAVAIRSPRWRAHLNVCAGGVRLGAAR